MRKLSKKSIISIIFTVLSALFIGFIFLHSSMSAETSSEESSTVLTFFQNLLNSLGVTFELSSFIVRKAAHFLEFAFLGILITITFYSYVNRPFYNMLSVLFVCLATAVADETIQLFVPGRASMVQDVLLDFSGALAGTLITAFVIFIIIANRKNNKSIE